LALDREHPFKFGRINLPFAILGSPADLFKIVR
jgi:hypothetical protein